MKTLSMELEKEEKNGAQVKVKYIKPALHVIGKTTFIITMCKQSPCNGKSNKAPIDFG